VTVPNDWSGLLVAAGSELALGATLGLGILIAFGAFAVAGRLLDVQVGFGLAQVFDPVSRHQIPVLNAAFNQIGVLVFFLLNGHHALLRGVVLSLEKFPLGAAWSISASSDAVMGQMTGLFMLGFALVAPVVFCVLLVELALGVVARNLPQMNMFVIALPAKTAVALIALSLWFSGIGGVMTRVYASIAAGWEKIMVLEVAAPALRRGQ
jgi:flagellar biosynthetic protein FliR